MTRRILIVDDERTIADTLSVIFRGAGYEAFAAYNGRSGLDEARRLVPDVVLTDVMMPELDGVSMAMEIYGSLPGVAVILFSGQAGTADLLRQAVDRGYRFELLQKPMHPDEIKRRVARALAPGRASASQ